METFDNKTVGKNIAKFRKLREVKASDVAKRLKLSEPAYLKYERGETAITVDILREIGEILNIDPREIVSATLGNFLENIQYSPISFNGNSTLHTANEKQNQMMLKLMENVVALNERLVSLLENAKKDSENKG